MGHTPVRVAVFFCTTALLALAVVSAQEPRQQEPTQIGPVIKVHVNSVLVPVVVRDSHGRAISDLKQSDFQLFDKSRPLTITSFTVEKRGANAADAGLEATTS